MPRKPFFRKHDGWWYIQLRQANKRFLKKLVKGKENEQQSYQFFKQIMAEGTDAIPPPTRIRVNDILRMFLKYSLQHNKKKTFDLHNMFLVKFDGLYGSLKPHEVTPEIVAAWLRANTWKGGQNAAVATLKRAFNWAYDNNKITTNPLRRVKKPPGKARERFLIQKERRQIYDNYPEDDPFRDFLFGMEETGCRPGELAAVTAGHVDLDLNQA